MAEMDLRGYLRFLAKSTTLIGLFGAIMLLKPFRNNLPAERPEACYSPLRSTIGRILLAERVEGAKAFRKYIELRIPWGSPVLPTPPARIHADHLTELSGPEDPGLLAVRQKCWFDLCHGSVVSTAAAAEEAYTSAYSDVPVREPPLLPL
ncbi:hypothetical protein K445DRAFT_12365 [Daldinia sp. EC12]|nr:hypothetical protein K445DRAFT_12365 [Daldinia sp. EC12]